jgi:hypothetical protein
LIILRQGSSEAPDSGEAILRSRGRPKLPATAGQARLREKPPPADIICFKRYSISKLNLSGDKPFFDTGVRPKGDVSRVGRLVEPNLS